MARCCHHFTGLARKVYGRIADDFPRTTARCRGAAVRVALLSARPQLQPYVPGTWSTFLEDFQCTFNASSHHPPDFELCEMLRLRQRIFRDVQSIGGVAYVHRELARASKRSASGLSERRARMYELE